MSVVLKQTRGRFKDQNGEYVDINVVAEQPLSEAITAIETKGVQTLESIPDDYTTLSNEVDELKEDLNDLSDEVHDLYSMDYKRIIHINNIGIRTSGDKQRVTFDASFSVPNNCIITKYGILYQNTFSDDNEIILNINSTPDDNDDIYIRKSEKNASSTEKWYRYRTAIAVNESTHQCVVMYYAYIKDSNNIEHLVRSECIIADYDSIKTEIEESLKETDAFNEIYEYIQGLKSNVTYAVNNEENIVTEQPPSEAIATIENKRDAYIETYL